MKQLFYGLFVALLLCCNINLTFAQQQIPPIPVDPNLRVGKLENGLTYYIRKNNLPENRADFYIAQKVGSILEEPEQSGLAHFLEHMCFNGTTHFPGKTLIEYLETIGVKFGTNLNAYTSIDETVYNIANVPVVREGIVDSCLLILHDWSNDLLLNGEEIDKERGVIHEEWRTRMSAGQRFMEKALPQMFPGTKYANCLPIGNMDVVDNFQHQALRDYYEKWYRPDLQGIIIVGGIEPDIIEGKIKQLFSDIPAQPDAAERIYYPVNDNEEPIVVIEKDKEQTNIQVTIYNKHDATPDEQKSYLSYMVEYYVKAMIDNMLNARLNELRQKSNPPFTYAHTYDGDFYVSKTKDAFTGTVVCKEGEIEDGIAALLREMERARRFGFTESEYARARAEYLRYLESAYNERDKIKNNNYVHEYVRLFLDNEPAPGIENEYAIFTQLAPNIPVQLLNETMGQLMPGNNQVITLFGPDKEGITYPTKEAILNILNQIKTEELTVYVDKVSDEPLISQMPKPGKIVSEKKNDVFGTTTLTLSNGVRVIIKETDFKADEIRMHAFSEGGSSLFPDSEILNISMINAIVPNGGLGNFSTVDLDKILAGKKAWASASVVRNTEEVSGSCSPKDFETMMQLTYLRFTAPRKDEDAFASYKNRTKASLQNQEMNPMVALSDSLNSAIYMNHPRAFRLKPDMVDRIDYDKVLSMYNDRYKDASDFTFIFVGNVDLKQVKPYIKLYLASLPSIKRKETFRDVNVLIRPGIYKNEFIKEQETAKASNFILYSGKCDYTLEENIQMNALDQILDIVYTEKVREEEGGTYGVSTNGSINRYPQIEFTFQIYFDTDPAKKDRLMNIIYAEIDTMTTEGPSETNLNKVKEYMLKKHQEDLKENSYWESVIAEYVHTGLDRYTDYETIVNNMTVESIQKFAAKLFHQGNRIEVNMISPAKE
ncbi:putative zinc protease [termite gut metagenome]|uniref:Putative zinc protease n=1 Tax=termite gut metagenome TaxID=433724 RepID=A0A5J4SIG4_9ZZZZ